MDWREIALEELERHFNPRRAVPDFEAHLAEGTRRSAKAREVLDCDLDVAYGIAPLQRLDLFRPGRQEGRRLPLHVFIHGGYWRALDKSDFSFLAEPVVNAGAMAAVINYRLCPEVTLDAVVADILLALAWLGEHGERLGAEAGRITVSGHSAGAHLAALALAHDWTMEGLPADFIREALLVSGIYDPAPVLKIAVNEEIGLTAGQAARNNVLEQSRLGGARVVIAVGGDEPAGWIAQSESLAEKCRENGEDMTFMKVSGRHHFDICFEMADPATAIGQRFVQMVAA